VWRCERDPIRVKTRGGKTKRKAETLGRLALTIYFLGLKRGRGEALSKSLQGKTLLVSPKYMRGVWGERGECPAWLY